MARKKRVSDNNLFENQEQNDLTLEKLSQDIYGGSLERITRPERIEVIAIDTIYPDPSQPRRAIPSVVRRIWDGTPAGVISALKHWQNIVEKEGDHAYRLREYIDQAAEGGDRDEGSIRKIGPLESSWLLLLNLAASIRRDGLTNPITVYKENGIFRLETGERRWLAHYLLSTIYPEDDYNRIKARRVDEPDVWRQATENNARSELNAISKARQFALLLMDLYGSDEFRPVTSFDHEKDFYAQVADGQKYRVPRGRGEQISSAMGLVGNEQIRRYRALLRLPHEAWESADDQNLSEYTLRTLMMDAQNDQELIIMIHNAYTVSTDTLQEEEERYAITSDGSIPSDGAYTVSTDTVSTKSQPGSSDEQGSLSLWEKRLASIFSPNRWRKMSPGERKKAYQYLREIMTMMEEIGFDD